LYALLEVVKATALIVFFLYELYLIKKIHGWEVFPASKLEVLFFITYVIFAVLAWLLGERRKTFLVFAYFITFQVIGLAVILKDFSLIPRILIPLLLVYLTLFLFKSPAEFVRDKRIKKYREVLNQLKNLKGKLKTYESNLRILKEEYKNLLKERENLKRIYEQEKVRPLEELLEKKEQLLREHELKIAELEEKIANLRRNNEELWNILEELDKGISPKEELKRLRKEKKKLIKENRELRKELETLREELRKKTEEEINLGKEIAALSEKVESLQAELERYRGEVSNLENLLRRKITDFLNNLFERVVLTPRALADLEALSEEFLGRALRVLRKLDRIENPTGKRFETLELKGKTIFKYKLSGGRIYFTLEEGKYKVLGVLEGEDDKLKNRFIRERFE